MFRTGKIEGYPLGESLGAEYGAERGYYGNMSGGELEVLVLEDSLG